MHWTILSDYDVFQEDGTQSSTDDHFEEISIGAATLVISRQADGSATVTRLISPLPSDYLRQEWQPGTPYHD